MFRFLQNTNHALRVVLVCALTILLSACGSGGSSDTNANTISGNAIKGVLINGTVRAYQTIPGSNQRINLGSATTNEQGEFSLSLNQSQMEFQAPILLEFEADSHTQMICDWAPTCLNAFNGSLYEFGEAMPLDPNFIMLGLADGNKAFLSPLSHLIVSSAQDMPGGLSHENIQTSSQQVAKLFSLPQSALQTKTADLSAMEHLVLADDAELAQAIWSAAFYELSQSNNWQDLHYQIDNLPLNEIYANAIALTDYLTSSFSDDDSLSTPAYLSAVNQQAHDKYNAISSELIHFVYEPLSLNLNEGDTIVLQALASSGDANITYQWFVDSQPISGANQAILTIPDSQLDNQGSYSVAASNGTNSIASAPVSVQIDRVVQALTISQQPMSQHIQLNQPFSLSVVATGEGELSYQWQRNGSIVPGATGATYNVLSASNTDEGSYWVVITNEYEEISSEFAQITVNEELLPVSILEQPQPLSRVEGMSANFSVTAQGGGYLGYQWYKDGTALPNETSAQLSLTQITTADAGVYAVSVSNSLGSLVSDGAELEVIPNSIALSIYQQPLTQTVQEGDSVSFSVGANGEGLLSYQWLFNGVEIAGATGASYQMSNAQLEDSGSYSVVITDDTSSISSNSAVLTVEGPRQLALSWSVPTQRENGESLPLDEIGGYVLEYGQDSANLEHRVEITDPSETYYTITDLPQGVLYLRMATIDHLGVQGSFSATVAINIP